MSPREIVYGQKKESILDQFLSYLRKIAIIKDIPDNSIILDMGCGYNGEFLNSVQNKILKGYGLDFKVSPKSSKNIILKRITNPNIKQFPNNTFDVITGLAVIEHVEHPDLWLKQCYNMLKPGGILLLTTPSLQTKPILEFMAYKLHIISEQETRDHKQYFIPKTLSKALNLAGFKKQSIYCKRYFLLNILAKAVK